MHAPRFPNVLLSLPLMGILTLSPSLHAASPAPPQQEPAPPAPAPRQEGEPTAGATDADAPLYVMVGDVVGRVVKQEGEEVTLELQNVPGTITVSREQLSPEERYLLNRRRAGEGDARSWQELARFAGEHDMHLRRIQALEHLRELEPGQANELEAQLRETRQVCATDRIGTAEALIEAGRYGLAETHLKATIERYAACEAGEQAKELLASLARQNEARRAEQQAAMDERRAAARGDGDMDRAHALIERGEERLAQARGKMDNPSRAVDELEDARAGLERALRLLDRAAQQEQRAAQADSSAEAARTREGAGQAAGSNAGERAWLQDVAVALLMNTYLELGHLYAQLGDQQSAWQQVGLASQLDANDPRLETLRVSIAASHVDRR